MRKTGSYGYNKWPVNFEFPTVQDLLTMPKSKAIKIVDLKYTRNGGHFGGFQLIYSNGVSSPVFAA